MVKVLCPSTTKSVGHLEVITLHHNRDAAPDIVFHGLTGEVDSAMLRQAWAARRLASTLLVEDWLSCLAKCDIATGRIMIEFAVSAEREKSSFGLAFLVGMLAVALDTTPQESQAFTGEILEVTEVGAPPNVKHQQPLMMKLKQVAGLEAKTRACADAGCGILYYPFEYENAEIVRAELEYWPGVRPQACRLIPLNPRLPVASLLNLAINLAPLWRRLEDHANGPRFAFHLLEAMRISRNKGEFPEGIGRFLAGLRKQGTIDEKSDLTIRACFDRWRKACSPDKIPELLKAVISKDPSQPVDVASVEVASPDADVDIARWLSETRLTKGPELEPTLAILRTCRQLATDFGPYQNSARRLITEAAGLIGQAADSSLRTPTVQQLSKLLAICGGFIEQVKDIDSREITQLVSVLEKIYRTIEQIGLVGKEALQDFIASLLHQIHVASVVSAKGIPERDPKRLLQIEFSVVSPPETEMGHFKCVNHLQVAFKAGESVSCTMPSPVLLFDSSWQQCRSFSRRTSFALADDAMHRLPLSEMEVIQDLWNLGGARIGFRFPDANSFNVFWEPSLGPWPPSIDAQLFVLAMAKSGTMLQPRSIIDVGTGTGYLACAAHAIWPSIEKATLVESLPMSLALACANLTPRLTPGQQLYFHRARFQDLSPNSRADILICAPPYLPERPLVPEGIEMATNGTDLLEEIVSRGADWAREVWISFSSLAWREFSRSLLAAKRRYQSVAVLRRDFVPFRVPWLEPVTLREGGTEEGFAARLRYYEDILLHRGLIDVDSRAVEQRPEEYLAEHHPGRLLGKHVELHLDEGEEEQLDRILNTLRTQDSRGYRFWHEVRVVRLVAADKSN